MEREILSWDSRDLHTSVTDQSETAEAIAELNQRGDLHDSRLSMPSQSLRHSIVNVKNPMLVRDPSQTGTVDEIVCLEIDKVEEKRASLTGCQISEPVKVEKAPVKRVSFSNTHSVIHDTGEELIPVRHRDSITSASTDSSEDSTSSGEGRLGGMSHRNSKLRAKIPVTTGTTKQISEMVQTSLDGSTGSMDSSVEEWKPSGCNQNMKEMAERRKSAPAGEMYNDPRGPGHVKDQRSMSQTMNYDTPMSPSPVNYLPFQHKGTRGITSPTPQKGHRTHSRGSSISSVDSGDSYQGHMISPTTEIPHPDHHQSSWIQYDESLGNFPLSKGQPIIRQGPPTAQKPACIKKNRPQSSPVTGSIEKGHKRNTSKSSLESVEELQECPRGAIPVCSPLPPRTIPYPPVHLPVHPPSAANYTRSMSQPCPSSIPHSSHGNSLHYQTMESEIAPASSHTAPNSPAPLPPSAASCLSPRLSAHRVIGPKPVTPPVAPSMPAPTPPALVPSAPRNPDASVKTHKKRPSGGNIVVNGNDAESLQRSGLCPDIVASPRSHGMMTSEVQGQGQSVNKDDSNQGGPLPFMAELNKQMHKTPPASGPGPIYDTIPAETGDITHKSPPTTLPKPTNQRLNGNASQNINNTPYHSCDNKSMDSANNRPPSSSSSVSSSTCKQQQQQQQQVKKHVPPPPPKRSQSTKLSSSSSLNTSQSNVVPNDSHVPNTEDHVDPIYDNCDGILDISDLPPPPPELLEDLHAQSEQQGGDFQGQRSGKVKPPPPPPKRNKETHLSMS